VDSENCGILDAVSNRTIRSLFGIRSEGFSVTRRMPSPSSVTTMSWDVDTSDVIAALVLRVSEKSSRCVPATPCGRYGGLIRDASGTWVVSGDHPSPVRPVGDPPMYRGPIPTGKTYWNRPAVYDSGWNILSVTRISSPGRMFVMVWVNMFGRSCSTSEAVCPAARACSNSRMACSRGLITPRIVRWLIRTTRSVTAPSGGSGNWYTVSIFFPVSLT
jgi:hypothetical protein